MSLIVNSKMHCDSCGDDTAAVEYERDDGSHFIICHKCKALTKNVEPSTKAEVVPMKPVFAVEVGPPTEWRGVSQKTMEFYGVKGNATDILFPYYNSNELSGYKCRKREDKKFWLNGDIKEAGLFGQNLFAAGGKFVTITEGEMDALAGFQMHGSKHAYVSLKNGAGAALADCKHSYEWLDSFETIVLCFDADEPGQKAAAEVAALFAGKVKIMKHIPGCKDANDYLMNSKIKEYTERWWAAEEHHLDGIICTGDLWNEVAVPLERAPVDYPYSSMNGLTYGIRPAELVTITAGSGLGKSQFLRELVWHIHEKTEDNIGILFLEEGKRRTVEALMSIAANKPLHLPQEFLTDEERERAMQERREAFDKVHGQRRLYLFDYFGSDRIDHILSRLRYMVKGLGCKYLFLDHVTILVSSQEYGDERKALDEIMTKLRMFVQETGVALFVVSHLKRPEGKGHEEGAATSLAQLRGSGAIGQLSDIVIGLERNGQAEDITERNTTRIRILKNRFSGLTGPAGRALYTKETGRMLEFVEEEM